MQKMNEWMPQNKKVVREKGKKKTWEVMTKGCACNSTTYKNNLVYSLTGSNRNSQLLIKRDAGWGSRAWLAGYCGSNARSTMSFSEIRQVGKAGMGYIYL